MKFDFLINRRRLLADHRLLGSWGEKYSEKFLKKKGLKTLTRNFTCKTGEIDLVMVDSEGSIIFVEVRTKTDEDFSSVESSITSAKKKRLKRAVRYFISTNNLENRSFRFDIIAIVLGQKGKPLLRHYENAFVL
ncbi:MAG: YraN family protein [Sedimentisphaerales bacterium]|nr:YraN family protein [Sedimentisphaerales bacterium]